MATNEAKALEALAKALSAKVKNDRQSKPPLRLIQAAKPSIFDSITRESILRRVRYLAKAYQLQWLIDQETFNVAGIDCLEDRALSDLLRNMEHARECGTEGISYAEAGLVRSNADDLPQALWSNDEAE